jgi:hypothetical protein
MLKLVMFTKWILLKLLLPFCIVLVVITKMSSCVVTSLCFSELGWLDQLSSSSDHLLVDLC